MPPFITFFVRELATIAAVAPNEFTALVTFTELVSSLVDSTVHSLDFVTDLKLGNIGQIVQDGNVFSLKQ